MCRRDASLGTWSWIKLASVLKGFTGWQWDRYTDMTQNKGLQGREKLGTNAVYPSRRHGSFLTEEGEKTWQERCIWAKSWEKGVRRSLENRISWARQPERARALRRSFQSDHTVHSWAEQKRLEGPQDQTEAECTLATWAHSLWRRQKGGRRSRKGCKWSNCRLWNSTLACSCSASHLRPGCLLKSGYCLASLVALSVFRIQVHSWMKISSSLNLLSSSVLMTAKTIFRIKILDIYIYCLWLNYSET